MPADDPNAHIASIEVAASADAAFAFMADGMAQTTWALGSWDRRDEGGGIVSGVSLFDGQRLYVRLESDPRLRLVDYYAGGSPDELVGLVQARIVPGEDLGRDPGCSVVTLVVWRGARQTPESWARTYHAFRTEVHLIKARIEGLLPWPVDVAPGGVGGVVPAAGAGSTGVGGVVPAAGTGSTGVGGVVPAAGTGSTGVDAAS
ncbi:hypothetical protein [Capillimicrobium parvum]|uniref:SRPBCC family protein n=1 Tax=Capillimicrobium parvum TaxID=2884022 RepID=A0A9E6XU59_9ACTN|nr:hypothetical protein [Capillimicrobium parvum]UGS33816.1 hypothetical protein DSM104329_00181 [Capillimicrobium parvum]